MNMVKKHNMDLFNAENAMQVMMHQCIKLEDTKLMYSLKAH